MTADQFRALALDLEGVVEGAHMGHPDFRLGGRIFASLQADERTGMVKVSPEEQEQLLEVAPDAFTPASGAWGRQGCTMVALADADIRTVRGAMTLAWELATALGPTRSASGSRARRIPAPRKPAKRTRS